MSIAVTADDPQIGDLQELDKSEQPPRRQAKEKREGKGLSRYATIIISVALFLVFDMGVLVLNFFISAQIAEDAVAVNLAGRQRMLSQRMVKTLLLTETNAERGDDIATPLKELQLTTGLFDTTLTAFELGGAVKGTSGQITPLEAADTAEGTQIVQKALSIWQPYHALIEKATSSGVLDRTALSQAIDYGVENNLTLLKLMNDLTNERESVASDRAANLRMIQAGGIGLALINFVIILFHFIRKLRDADSETEKYANGLEDANNTLSEAKLALEDAKRETDEILQTVNEGLFLIDKNGEIGDQHSADLARILPDRQIAGESLGNLMRPLLGDKDYAMTLDYLPLLFQKRLKEKMLLNVNPLEEVAVHLNINGRQQERILSFRFNRVFEGKEIRHVLVSVTDVTDKVMLARELEASQERAKEQMELLFGIVHVEPARASAFLENTRSRVGNINELLKTAEIGGQSDLRGLVDGIFRHIHAVKGDAGMLGLSLFENAAHRFEDELNRLREQPSLQGPDFVPLALELDEMRRYLFETGELVEKIAGFGSLGDDAEVTSGATGGDASGSAPAHSNRELSLIDSLHDLVRDIAASLGRKVDLSANNFDPRLIPAAASRQITDMLVQLVRNAVSHGIEAPVVRRESAKAETGIVHLETKRGAQGLEISVRDDGGGLSLEKIRKRALEKGLRSEQQLEQMNKQQLVSLIFEPGFSTADEVTEVSGRGVGMDIVKDELTRLGGRMRIAYAPKTYTQFTMVIPEDGPKNVKGDGA